MTTFKGDDPRCIDPKFQPRHLAQYLDAIRLLDSFAQRRFQRHVVQLAVRWLLDRGISVALWGGRHRAQVEAALGVATWSLNSRDLTLIERILRTTVLHPVGAEINPPLQHG